MRPILALSLLALAACGADGQPIAPSGAAQVAPPDAPIIGPDGNPVAIAGSGNTESFEVF